MKSLHHRPIKAAVLFLIFFFAGTSLFAQDITGTWNGALNVQGKQLRIIFHITKTGDGYSSTMDSPDQGATGIPVATTTYNGSELSLAIPSIGLQYQGEFKNDSIIGSLNQNGKTFPMNLSRNPVEKKPIARPQEPKPPYPYRSEEITFENKAAGITLAGTLTIPATGSNFKAVVLISGSGPQDRNEELVGHKPFLVIADYLTRHGIAVLRYDDRGVAQSTGDFKTATIADFATDTESAVAWLKTRKEINARKIGLMGHSEGGVVAPIVAERSKDVSFIIMLAGTGIRGDSLLLLQKELIYRVSGMSESDNAKHRAINARIFNKIIHATGNVTKEELSGYISSNMKEDIAEITPKGMTVDDCINKLTSSLSIPWMQYFLRHDPAPVLEKVKCPVLAVNGSKDLQVSAKENLAAINNALMKGGNKDITVKEYPGLNHLFQECITGSPNEYATIEQTFSPVVLNDLADWISKR